MIQKLKPEINELFGAECPIYSSQALLDTVNQLVDAVNELQKNATISKMEKVETRSENVQPDTESRPENVQDKFAEQRKWIGKLCKFRDKDYKDDQWDYGLLQAVANAETAHIWKAGYFKHNLGHWYEYCEPVKPDDDIIYKGVKDED